MPTDGRMRGLLLRAILPHPSSAITMIVLIVALMTASGALAVSGARLRARWRRRYLRLNVIPYRGDDPTAAGIVSMYEALHKRLLRRWWRRLLAGQPSVGLEVHFHQKGWLSLTCPEGMEHFVIWASPGVRNGH